MMTYLFYKIKFVISAFFLILFISKHSYSTDSNLIRKLNESGNHNIFVSILERSPLFLSLINNTVASTIYAPTDEAFSLMPKDFMDKMKNNNLKYTTKLILTHIFSGDSLNSNKEEGIVLTLDGSLYYTYNSNDLFIKDIVVQGDFLKIDNYTIIPVSCVMFLQQSSKDYRVDKEIQDKYKFTSCCLQTEEEYDVFIKGL